MMVRNKALNALPRLLGVEIEVARFNQDAHISTWVAHKWVRDGSVSSGKEMVVEPYKGDQFVVAMVDLYRLGQESNWGMDSSCGFHVHVDARTITFWEARNIILLYAKVEADIYRYLVKPARKLNRFCYPLTSPVPTLARRDNDSGVAILDKKTISSLLDATRGTIKKAVLAVVYPEAIAQGAGTTYQEWLAKARGDKYGRHGGHKSRYAGLNLHSWQHRGTIEFRMKEGTTDPYELVCWPLFCGWLVEIGATLSPDRMEKIMGLYDFAYLLPQPVQDWVMMKMRSSNSITEGDSDE